MQQWSLPKEVQPSSSEVVADNAPTNDQTVAASSKSVTANDADVTNVEEENSEAPEEEVSDSEETVEEEKLEIKLETAPADFRFPTTNQSRHCFTRYIEYHRCIAVKGDDAPECSKFAKYYRSLCPGEWVC
ncbi:Cytochrome c oxidase subunit 6b-1 [Apostasia shenzhenica]|uniref:Cytochrome c oxidase subunit 6b-1 n=1 Tax=Apostasia shenzhenica TaxID=1088818 RepID=A0A2I0A1X4_9ASPA|nr:Cytochrome c oxidase subunit 6b-1 [Apostasia shenzhenica]